MLTCQPAAPSLSRIISRIQIDRSNYQRALRITYEEAHDLQRARRTGMSKTRSDFLRCFAVPGWMAGFHPTCEMRPNAGRNGERRTEHLAANIISGQTCNPGETGATYGR